jgi:hypothetical protein
VSSRIGNRVNIGGRRRVAPELTAGIASILGPGSAFEMLNKARVLWVDGSAKDTIVSVVG